jgi:acetyl-CoA carboxylase alpha subunit
MAAKQGVRSADLLADGIVDRVIPEYPDAAAEPEPFCLRVGATLRDELAALGNADTPRRLTERARRFDRIVQPDPVLAPAG